MIAKVGLALKRLRAVLPMLPYELIPNPGIPSARGMWEDDIFLASYPRSGNTWMRTIIGYLLYDESRITSLKDLNYLVPDIYIGIPRHNNYSQPRVIKTHQSYGTRHNANRTMAYQKNIYVVRHPFDVMQSHYHHYYHASGGQQSFDEFIDRIVHGATHYSSWQQHVLSWYYAQKQCDMLYIRYEDLVEDFFNQVTTIAHFLDVDYTESKIARVRELTSRERMVDLQKVASLTNTSYTYVRETKEKRRAAQPLTEAQKDMIYEFYQKAMDLFDYRR